MSDHKCEFPVQPPEGSWANPGPCRTCRKTWERAQAELALEEAQAAMAAPRPRAVAGPPVDLGDDPDGDNTP